MVANAQLKCALRNCLTASGTAECSIYVSLSLFRAGENYWRRGVICMFRDPRLLNEVMVYSYIQDILSYKEIIVK